MRKNIITSKKKILVLVFLIIAARNLTFSQDEISNLKKQYYSKKFKGFENSIDSVALKVFINSDNSLEVVDSKDFFDTLNARKKGDLFNLNNLNKTAIINCANGNNVFNLELDISSDDYIHLILTTQYKEEQFEMFVSYLDSNYVILREYWYFRSKWCKNKIKRKLKRIVIYKRN